MKVFRPKKKPSHMEIVSYLIIIMIGFLCRLAPLPGDNALLRSALLFGRGMLPVGIGFMIGIALRWSRYNRLSPEDQRDEDRQDRDERNLMIRDRAAWVAYNILVCTLAVISVLFYIMDDWKTTLLCLGMSIFGMIVWWIAVVWIQRDRL